MRDLRALLSLLRRENEIVDVDAEVDPHLEIAEVHRRVIAGNGPALLFRNPKNAAYPVVTNLFGTRRRVELAFGSGATAFVREAARLPAELLPPSFGKLWEKRGFFQQAAAIGTRVVGGAPVTEVVAKPALGRIPMLTSWSGDGGAFVTLPLVYTEHPENGSHNLGMYRVQRRDETSTGIHWQIGKGGGFHHWLAEQKGQDLPVNVFVGGPPGLLLSAVAPLPENVPELLLASLLAGERLRRSHNPVGPLPLVADCEFAFVGRVPAGVRRPEGPFGDHYGYYSLRHDFPIIQLDAVCHRKDAIWPATVVGKPRQEDFYIGDFLQELLAPLFPLVMPAVRDLWSYGETGYHALSAAVVYERYAREALSAAFRILGEGQLTLTKFLLVLDRPMDLRDFKSVLIHVLERFNPETDLYIFANTAMDTLDYAGPELNRGSKGVLMGLGPARRELPGEFRGEIPTGVTEVEVYCPGCLVVSGLTYTDEPDQGERIAAGFAGWPLVVLVDDAALATRSDPRFLWTVFTRMEPANDLRGRRLVTRGHYGFAGTVVIDARMKPWYPEELFCDEETARTVSTRWAEYFPRGNVPMGDSDGGHLG